MAKKKLAPVENQLSLLGEILPQEELTEEQTTFIEYDGKKSVILSATAGSGKTFSCVKRLTRLLERGVDPSRIIFFSFTKAAADELKKRVGRDDIEIKTIHAFCVKVLSQMGKFKPIVGVFEFIQWFKKKFQPSSISDPDEREMFEEIISRLYDEMDSFSAAFSAFKLQSAYGIKCKVPDLFIEYSNFLKETKSRDFSDMLIEVRNYFQENKWLKMFKDRYDYIFVDEYQDTSAIQMQILLALNAKHYYLVGDKNQCIYGYSGASYQEIESMLLKRREVEKMTLSTNFRSDQAVVANSNKYSSLQAVANSKEEGKVETQVFLKLEELIDLINKKNEVAVLVRTNSVIKRLEYELLKRLIPMRYFNLITESEIKDYKKGEIKPTTKSKLEKISNEAKMSVAQLVAFIEQNSNSKKIVTSIHKSKGREFEVCVVVNSIAPEVLEENGFLDKLNDKQKERLTFNLLSGDEEPKNIHYVAVSRSKHELYFMIYDV